MRNNYKICSHKRSYTLLFGTFSDSFGPWQEASRGVFHIVITLGGRKNIEKMRIL